MRREKLMKSFAQFLTACAISSPVFANNLKEYYYGDSIAVGYGGKSAGSRREGASPEEILSYIEINYLFKFYILLNNQLFL